MNRQMFGLDVLEPYQQLVGAEFAGNAASDPLSSTFTSTVIKAVKRTALGTYEVELIDTWPGVVAKVAHATDATPDTNGIAQIVSETISTNGKFIVKYRVNGSDANADSAVKISFLLLVRNRR